MLCQTVRAIWSRAYSHHHKLHGSPAVCTGSAQGPIEVWQPAEIIKPMVDLEHEVPGIKQTFATYPHFTWDNYFSGDHIMDWLGENGFGATMMCRQINCQAE